MNRRLLALALVGGVAVSSRADDGDLHAPQVLLAIPGTTSGAPFETTPSTVLNWSADDWNPVRHPQSLDVATWGKDAGATVAGDSTLCPTDVYGEPMDLVSSAAGGSAAQSVYQQVFPGQVLAGALLTASFDVAAPLGVPSVPASLRLACGAGNATAISCSRSDGGACTTQVSSSTQTTVLTTLTSSTPVTLTGTYSCSSNATSTWPTVQAGHYAVSKGYSICASNARVTRGSIPMPWRRPVGRDLNRLTAAMVANFSAWSNSTAGGLLAPTVTDNVAVAPDGTTTADRLDIPAWTAGQASVKYALISAAGGAGVFEVWLRADAPTSVTLSVQSGGIGAWKACSVTTTWSRCTLYFAGLASTTVPAIGPDARLAGHAASGAATTVYAAQPHFALYGDAPAATGTVPQVPSSTLFPRGPANHRGVGGATFSDSNYFTFGANNDVTDFVGDFMGCATVVVPATATNGAIFGDGIFTAPSQGWYVDYSSGQLRLIQIHGLTGTFDVVGGTATPGGRNVVCFGRVGTTIYAKVNDGAVGTTAAVDGIPSWTAGKFYVGRAGQTAYFSNALVEEIWLTTTPWNSAVAGALTNAALKDGSVDHDFPDDANTVLHLRGDAYDGTTWRAPQGALTTVGTVGYSDAWAPTVPGLTSTSLGPFSDSNYLNYTAGGASDVLDSTGDRYGCVNFTFTAAPTANAVLWSNGFFDIAGGYFYVLGPSPGPINTVAFHSRGANHGSAQTANTIVVGGPNAACWWRTGNSVFAKLNSGTTVTANSNGPEVLGSAYPLRIGRYEGPGASPTTGTITNMIHGLGACPDVSCEAWATKQIQRALGQVGAQGQVLTNTRSTISGLSMTRDAATGSLVRPVPAGVTAVEGPGLGIWRQSTNGYPYSNSPCQAGNVAQAGWTFYNTTCANDVTTGPDGLPADQFTQLANAGGPYVASVGVASTSVATVSVYGKRVSGTGYIGAMIQCTGGLLTCTCSRDDGGACTATPGTGLGPLTAIQCVSKASIDSSRWVRLSATATCGAPSTVYTAAAYPGEPGVTTADTAYLTDLQTEAGYGPAPYVATTTVAVQRNADVVTTPNPLLAGDANWCAEGTFDLAGRAWNAPTVNTLWSTGSLAGPSRASLQLANGSLTFVAAGTYANEARIDYPTLLIAKAPHVVKACVAGPRAALYLDGKIVQGTSASWADLTAAIPPATLALGADAAGANILDGYVRDFTITRWFPTMADLDAMDSAVVMLLPLSSNGRLMDEDAGTVSHVYWNGTGLVDTRTAYTNLALQSEALDVSPWSVSNLGAGPTIVTANQAVAPNGTLTADRVDLGATANNAQYSLLLQTLPVTAQIGAQYTASIWMRAVTGTANVYLTITDFNEANSATIDCALTTEWKKCSVTHTRTATSATYIQLGTDARRVSHTDVRAGASIYAWGADVHRGPVLDAYAPTTTVVASGGVVVTGLESPGVWAQGGTVPQVAANVSPFVPGKAGAGPFSSANNYTGPTTSMEWTGDWSVTAVFSVTGVTNAQGLVGKYTAVTGWRLYTSAATGIARLGLYDGTAVNIPTGAVVVGGINVLSAGKSGGTCYIRLNNAAAATGACGTMTTGALQTAKIGTDGVSTHGDATTIYEVIASTAPYSDALHDARFRRVFGMEGSKGEAITNTRATTATYTANRLVWTAPANVARIESNGMFSESARTNVLLSSGTVTTTTALNANWLAAGAPTYSTSAGTAPDGAGTWGRITSTTTADIVYQSRTVASTTTVTASTWVKADTAIDTVSIQAGCTNGTNTTCTCGRSDGAPCTARPGVTATYHCTADHSIGTTPVRIWATATCDVAKTTATFGISPGSYQSATGTADFALAQLEAGPYPTSYIPTTSAAVTRNADITWAPAPLTASDDFAVGLDFQYGTGRDPSAAVLPYLWAWDNTTGSNDQILYSSSATQLTMRWYNSDNSAFRPVAITHGYTMGSAHRILGTLSPTMRRLYSDGVLMSSDVVSLTRSPLTLPANLYFGGNSIGSAQLDGYVRNVKVCSSSDVTRCQ